MKSLVSPDSVAAGTVQLKLDRSLLQLEALASLDTPRTLVLLLEALLLPAVDARRDVVVDLVVLGLVVLPAPTVLRADGGNATDVLRDPLLVPFVLAVDGALGLLGGRLLLLRLVRHHVVDDGRLVHANVPLVATSGLAVVAVDGLPGLLTQRLVVEALVDLLGQGYAP
jgi:hypothetical protein